MNESTGYKIFKIANTVIMLMIIVICLYPYLNVAAKAFNDGIDTGKGGIGIFPRVPTLYNFEVVLQNKDILICTQNSVLRVILGTALTLFVIFSCAYALRKRNFKGYAAILIFLMIPMYFNAGIILPYVLYSKVHLMNNFLVYLLPSAFNFFNMLIARTFMITTIPDSLEESAKLDGANEFKIFFKIFLPLSKPIIATIGLYTAVWHWNDWTTTLYYASQNPSVFTLQYKLMQILRESQASQQIISTSMITVRSAVQKVTPEAIRCAQIIIVTVPIVLIYPFLQKYFIKGMLIGAVKE